MEQMTIIRGGTLVTADEMTRADILIEGEKVVQVGSDLEVENALVIEAAGKYVLPGGVDPHTHFDLPMFGTVSSDDHYTGHKAAAFGGTTTVMDFIPQEGEDLPNSIGIWRAKASKAAIDYGFHMNITHLTDRVAAQIPHLLEEGIATLKVFMAYNGRLRLSDMDIFRVLRIAGRNGMLTMLHAENGDVIDLLVAEALEQGRTAPLVHAQTRPAWGVVDATMRGAALAAQAGAPLYVVHMNAAGEVDMLRYARAHGAPVMGETCPQYLFFSEEDLARPDGAKWICSPPMRSERDQQALWLGLQEGILQTVGTDHCPFFYDGMTPIVYEGEPVAIPGKELGKSDFTKIPNGLPAVQDRLPVLWTHGVRAGRITPTQFVALTSTNPAKIFGLFPRKGTIAMGSDADLVIWDPERRVKYGVSLAQHRTDYNLFEGWELVGYPEKVFLRGKMIVEGHQWHGQRGGGRFLPRTTSSLI